MHLVRILSSALIFMGTLGCGISAASTATVPDAMATIQAAIDSGVDTILVREGTYSETPSAYRGVVLIGIGAVRPKLGGLAISNPYEWLSLDWSINAIDFDGPVTISTLNFRARFVDIEFSDCVLSSGLEHVGSEDINDIEHLSLTRCRLPTMSYANAASITMQADTIDVGVRWTVDGSVRVVGCWFRGGPGLALDIQGSVTSGEVTSCIFEDYAVSLFAPSLDGFHGVGFLIESNIVRRMRSLAMYAGCQSATVRGNLIEDCSEGIRIAQGSRLRLYDNTVMRCGGYGFWLDQPEILLADRNVVSHCGGSAITIGFSGYSDLAFTHNTLVKNVGSGIDMLADVVMNNVTVRGNLVAWNGEYGLHIRQPQPSVVLECNNWFGNARGPVVGPASGSQDHELDPLFCNVDIGDVNLFSDSPLLTLGCGDIGARGIGCSAPALKALSVTSSRGGLGISWEFEATTDVESWIERADHPAGPWDSLGTGRANGSNGFQLLDGAVAPDRAYYYRVAWRVRGIAVYGPPTSGAWTGSGRLSSVSPNPATREVTVDWVLARPGITDIRIYDLAGREVSVVARGSFGVGRHQVRWNGRWNGRGIAPAGMYIVRVTSAERTTSHRFLLLR